MNAVDLSDKQPQNLEEWTALLREEEMPIFSNTAQKIYRAIDDKKKGAMELASIILQDPNLTAKLLRVGNSPYYNPSRQKIGTVSRAIVILGIHLIRELTLACSFFESILSPANKERANKEIASAIHAAVQARELALVLQDPSPEEVFVAALLQNIGQVAFWCSSNKQTIKIHELLSASTLETLDAEKHILGFSLAELGRKLSKSWHLGGLVEESLNHPASIDKRIQTVQLGNKICHAIDQGWESAEMEHCLLAIHTLTGADDNEIKTKIQSNTLKAVDIARQFGAHDASRFIGSDHGLPQVEPKSDLVFDRKQIQFQIMQDITAHISGNIDLNVLFEFVMEGIHRGVEMDRTLLMLMSPDKKSLSEKFSLGWEKRNPGKIQIYHDDTKINLLFKAIREHDDLWLQAKQHAALYTSQIDTQFGRHDCFVLPIQVEGKSIGLIYCDRAMHEKELTMEDFTAVKHFVKQAQIGLTLYRMKNH